MKSQGEQPGRRELVLHALRDAREPMQHRGSGPAVGTAREHGALPISQPWSLAVRSSRSLRSRKAPGRPLSCSESPRMDPTGPRQYRLLAEVLVDALAASPAPRSRRPMPVVRVGVRRKERLRTAMRAPLSRLITLLDEVGFAPELRAQQSQIALRHCPFLNSRNAEPTSSVRYTSASCRAPWMSGMPRRPLINSPLRRTR